MRKMLAVCAAMLSFTLSAKELPSDKLSAGTHLSLLGYGVHAGYQFSETFSARAEINKFTKTNSKTKSDIHYDITAKLSTFALLANYKPFTNGFRVTGGLYHNSNNISADTNYAHQMLIDIGDQQFNTADIARLNAKVKFAAIAPYLGLGYGAKLGNFNLEFDAGVLLQGSPNVSLDVLSNLSISAKDKADLKHRLAIEERQLEEELDEYRYWPTAKISLSYRF